MRSNSVSPEVRPTLSSQVSALRRDGIALKDYGRTVTPEAITLLASSSTNEGEEYSGKGIVVRRWRDRADHERLKISLVGFDPRLDREALCDFSFRVSQGWSERDIRGQWQRGLPVILRESEAPLFQYRVQEREPERIVAAELARVTFVYRSRRWHVSEGRRGVACQLLTEALTLAERGNRLEIPNTDFQAYRGGNFD